MSVMTITSADATASGKVQLQVTAKTSVAEGVCSLAFRDPYGRRLPDWTPGSHIDLTLANGLTRQYSLCGDRWDPSSYQVAVLHEPEGRGGSEYVHNSLRVGDIIEVAGPRNNFPLVPAERYLFIAGGIGITPLLPMLQQAEMLGTPWSLLYGGKSRTSMAFTDRLRAYEANVIIHPHDEAGHLPLVDVLADEPAATKVYACGPAPMLDALRAAHEGRVPHHLRLERFTPREQGAPIRSTSFEVELARTNTSVTVEPGVSILDAVARAGVPILASCKQGTCGTCETVVLAGEVDHRDSLLTDEERSRSDVMFPCVSRAASDRIVLDA